MGLNEYLGIEPEASRVQPKADEAQDSYTNGLTQERLQSPGTTSLKRNKPKMFLSSALSLALILFTSTTNSAPVTSIEAGSKHNLYLVTCLYNPCTGILCGRQGVTSYYTAAAYYADGPHDQTPTANPTAFNTVSYPYQAWEGRVFTARLGTYGSTVTSNITAGAATLAKGDIAGAAKVDSEDFVCFKDGATSVVVRSALGATQASCTAQYWCPSIQVS